MYGIIGSLYSQSNKIDSSIPLTFIDHRGSDSIGNWGDEFIKIGHTRLSIIDLSPFTLSNDPE